MTLNIGSASPMGSYFDGKGTNFAVFSKNASKIELCVFTLDHNNIDQEQRFEMPKRSGDIWHGYLPCAKIGTRYAYRAYGEMPTFNPNKLLIDPYTRGLDDYLNDAACLSAHNLDDSAAHIPKSLVIAENYDWEGIDAPNILWGDTVIYEAHVKSLTQLYIEIPADIRGTYAALAHPTVLKYLQSLGITSLELLPIQMHADEPRLQDMSLSNHWGYNVLAPFAIEPRYWSGRFGSTPLSEFKDAVKALHKAGIEVILDVVFNHSAELDRQGPTLSMRGLDNSEYYWQNQELADTDPNKDLNYSGCGNTLNLSLPHTLKLVADCLRYWISECHIDGFRFDLGTILGRTNALNDSNNSNNSKNHNVETAFFSKKAALFAILQQDPLISKVKLIAEPWDIGPTGYQLGNFPVPFAEWNDRFRDDMRNFWLYGNLSLGDFARRFAASSDFFDHSSRDPNASINMICAHDGFTLHDLVSFNDKHNLENGEYNRDGHSNNYSNNHGHEGLDTDDLNILKSRKNSQRALLMLLLLSQGTPQLLAGDELGHSMRGNNNAYCQDNEITWINWDKADFDLSNFTTKLIKIRRKINALTQNKWWDTQDEVCWKNSNDDLIDSKQWSILAKQGAILQIVLSKTYRLIINTQLHNQQIELTQELTDGFWEINLCSSSPSNGELIYPEHGRRAYLAPPNSISLLTYLP